MLFHPAFHPAFNSGNLVCRFVACLMAVNVLAVSGRAEPQVDATSHARVGDGPLHAYVGKISLQ